MLFVGMLPLELRIEVRVRFSFSADISSYTSKPTVVVRCSNSHDRVLDCSRDQHRYECIRELLLKLHFNFHVRSKEI